MTEILRFDIDVTEETLVASARLHNRFPPDTTFPQIDVLSDDFKELCTIIAKYNAQSYFRLRLLHRHTTIPDGQILLGSTVTELSGFWTRPTPISDIELQNIHPHIISADVTSCKSEGENNNVHLFPSEFREGPPTSFENIDSQFFTEFIDCLRTKGLENALGLEVIQGPTGKMIEFSFDIGSLLLEEGQVTAEVRDEKGEQFKLQETGWAVTVKDGLVCKTGETRCVMYSTGHIKFTDSKAKGVTGALQILRDEGVLAI